MSKIPAPETAADLDERDRLCVEREWQNSTHVFHELYPHITNCIPAAATAADLEDRDRLEREFVIELRPDMQHMYIWNGTHVRTRNGIHIYMSCVPRMNEWGHAYDLRGRRWSNSDLICNTYTNGTHVYMRNGTHIYMSRGPHMNESWHAYELRGRW